MVTEPRSADSELEPFEDDDDDDLEMLKMVPDMRDGTEELAAADDNESDALEPSNRDV